MMILLAFRLLQFTTSVQNLQDFFAQAACEYRSQARRPVLLTHKPVLMNIAPDQYCAQRGKNNRFHYASLLLYGFSFFDRAPSPKYAFCTKPDVRSCDQPPFTNQV